MPGSGGAGGAGSAARLRAAGVLGGAGADGAGTAGGTAGGFDPASQGAAVGVSYWRGGELAEPLAHAQARGGVRLRAVAGSGYAVSAASQGAVGGESPDRSGQEPQATRLAAFLCPVGPVYGWPGGGSRKARRCSIGLSTPVRSPTRLRAGWRLHTATGAMP